MLKLSEKRVQRELLKTQFEKALKARTSRQGFAEETQVSSADAINGPLAGDWGLEKDQADSSTALRLDGIARPEGQLIVGITTQKASTFEVGRFFHAIESKYICPADYCARKFSTGEGFNQHIRSDSHIGKAAG